MLSQYCEKNNYKMKFLQKKYGTENEIPLYKQPKACYNTQAKCKRTGGSMDRASDSGSEGWGFESLPVYHEKTTVLIENRGLFS